MSFKELMDLFEAYHSSLRLKLTNGQNLVSKLGEKIRIKANVAQFIVTHEEEYNWTLNEEIQKKNWYHINFSFKLLKRKFSALKIIGFSYISLSSLSHAKIIKFILTNVPNLEELGFKMCRWSEQLFLALLENLRTFKTKKLNFKFIEVGLASLRAIRKNRFFYIMSLVSTYADQFFHTQTNGSSNRIGYKYFYRAADILSRTSLTTKLYLGASKHHPEGVTTELNKYLIPLNVIIHENPWTAEK